MSENQGLPQVKRSLRRQMTLTLSGVIVFLLLLVGLPIIFITVRIQQQEAIRSQQDMADSAAQTLGNLIERLQSNQLEMALTDLRNPETGYISNQVVTILNLTISRVSAQMQETVENEEPVESLFALNPQIRGVKLFGPDGSTQDVAWRQEPLASESTQPTRESLALTENGISTQDAFFFDQNNVPILVIATPLSEANPAQGMALVWVEIPSIWPFLIDLKIGRTGYLFLVDENNAIVAAPDQFSDVVYTPQASLPLTAALSRPGLNGAPVLSRIAPIEDTPWQAVIEIPVSEANAGLRSLLIILVAIMLFGISLGSIIARIFSHRLLQPVDTLHQSAVRISEGDLSHRITMDRQDELGFLARTFNQMVATLERTINQLRTVSYNILFAQEAERYRIAQEIHDELGQSLTALKLNLWLSMQQDPNNQNLNAAHNLATEVQEKARTLSHELRPAMLDELGLQPTLEWYIDRLEQRANLAILLDYQANEENLSPGFKNNIYRMVIEALTNINKHAEASAVEIHMTEQDETLTLIISDDGVGFDTNILHRGETLGLASMQERAALLQGQMLIESTIGAGTKIIITLPLKKTVLQERSDIQDDDDALDIPLVNDHIST